MWFLGRFTVSCHPLSTLSRNMSRHGLNLNHLKNVENGKKKKKKVGNINNQQLAPAIISFKKSYCLFIFK